MIIDQVSNTLFRYLKESNQNSLFLAISGGVDSVVLLDILDQIKEKYSLSISLIHINYGMQKKSNNAEKLCFSLSLKYEIDIICKRINIGRSNFESNAREFRYNLFNKYSKKNNIDYILTAHHRDDQIETLHMKLEDHSDWVSFLGIREKYGKIIRPMLDISKKDIYSYAKKNKLKWIEDASNIDINYRRNNIRENILPKTIKNNPNHINFLIKKHYDAVEKLSVLKKKIEFFKNRYLIKIDSKFIILSNTSIEISDKVAFKIFYQELCQKHLNYTIYSTKNHWLSFHSFLSISNTGSSFILDKEINISKDKMHHYIYMKSFLSLKKVKINKKTFDWYQGYFTLDKKAQENSLLIDSIKIPEKLYNQGIYIRNWRYGDKLYLKDKKAYCSLNKIFKKKRMSVFEKKIHPIVTDSKNNILYISNIYNAIKVNNNKFIRLAWWKNE